MTGKLTHLYPENWTKPEDLALIFLLLHSKYKHIKESQRRDDYDKHIDVVLENFRAAGWTIDVAPPAAQQVIHPVSHLSDIGSDRISGSKVQSIDLGLPENTNESNVHHDKGF